MEWERDPLCPHPPQAPWGMLPAQALQSRGGGGYSMLGSQRGSNFGARKGSTGPLGSLGPPIIGS